MLAATPGGHLDLLMAFRDSFADYDRLWVISPGGFEDSLRSMGERVRTVPRFHGFSLRNLLLATAAVPAVFKDRPKLIVTTGSGSVVPYCFLARLSGARILFVETIARINNASAAGHILSRLASSVVVQWPDVVHAYPKARLCRPALLEQVAPGASEGEGTFVGVGTHVDQFDRLLRMVDDASERGVLPQPIFAQTGVCGYEPRSADWVRWLRPEEMDERIRSAKCVVCHAGSGLIGHALDGGRIPLVVPRRRRFREHVDDHQVQITEKLGDLGLIVPIEDEITAATVERAMTAEPRPHPLAHLPRLDDILRSELQRLSGP